jgi:hypothetical protein
MQINYSRVDPNVVSDFRAFKTLEPYIACVISDSVVIDSVRNGLANFIANSGCRAMSALGPDSCQWDDSVDWAVLEKNDFNGVNDNESILTSFSNSEIGCFLKNAIYLFVDPKLNYRSVMIFDIRQTPNFDNIKKEIETLGLKISLLEEEINGHPLFMNQ